MRTAAWLAMWGALSLALAAGEGSGSRAKPATTSSAAAHAATDLAQVGENVKLQGRIVWWGEALRRLHGIEHDEQDAKSAVALETTDGQLVPIVKDSRGRGFWLDERLHDQDMELVVRQRPGLPWVQVISVYTIRDDQTYELDYWCDICAIPMFELKPCECCQGETRLRERAADGSEREAGVVR